MIAAIDSIQLDPEFEGISNEFALKPEELNLLEAGIEADGCRDALVVWRGLLVDGHNRYRYCRRFNVPFTTWELQRDDRSQVITWIVNNQLGRRNISDERKSYWRGKRTAAERKKDGKHGTKKVVGQSGLQTGSTYERMAKEFGVGAGTISRDVRFSAAVDAIAEKEGVGAKEKILSGESGLSMEEIRQGKTLADAKPLTLRSALRQQRAKEKAMSTEAASGAISQESTERFATEKQKSLAELFESVKRIAAIVDSITSQKDRWITASKKEHWTDIKRTQLRSKFSAVERDMAAINKFLK